MITWMLYAVLVSVLVIFAARSVESIGRSIGYPVRWVWAGAMLLVVALTALAPYRVERRGLVQLPDSIRVVSVPGTFAAPSWGDELRARVADVGRALNVPIGTFAQFVERQMPRHATTYAFVFWALVTAALVALFTIVHLRFRRARRNWPLADMQGVRVRVAPNVGPVVVGVTRPEIVVPRWLLGRAAEEQRLVVAHEAEHVRARDTMLLGAACVVAAIMPWNPAVWYMLSRLRLAVELDCDARVLRAGAAPHSYGALLIDVAENNSGFRLGAPALADDSSHLQQRIMAMNPGKPKFALARGGVVGALALVAVLTACEAKMPTSGEIDKMDAASAERAAVKLSMLKSSDSLAYIVDDKRTDLAAVNAIPANLIGTIEVKKGAGGGTITIRTKKDTLATDTFLESGRNEASLVKGRRLSTIRKDTSIAAVVKNANLPSKTPLLYINGVKSPASAMGTLVKEDIESVEVLKGSGAAAYVNDPDAANGVIVIKMKPGTVRK